MEGIQMAKDRKDIPREYKWNVEAMYETPAGCEKDLQHCLELAEKFQEYRGSLETGPKTLLAALKDRDAVGRRLSKAVVYAELRRCEDNRVPAFQALMDKAMMTVARVTEAGSFFEPELASIPEEKLRAWIASEPGLAVYGHYIDDMLRKKAHILSKEEEKLLAQLSEISGVMDDTFTMLSDADFKFGTILDEKGDEVEVTHGSYIPLVSGKDRRVRKEAYEHMYAQYEKYRNTVATLYSYSVKQDVAMSRIRGFGSALEAAVFEDNVSVDVYNNLIDVVNAHLPAMHRYVALRKKLLNLPDLAMYDIYVPVLNAPDEDITFEQAQAIIDEALAPMGDEYRAIVRNAFASRWADVYENEGKTSGAFSSGCYDSIPYILLNYAGKLDDVFTVIHEMGHSMQTYYSARNQEFINADYPIFTAEVASTVNESLLYRHLIDRADDPLRKAYLINQYLDGFKGTLFRQTQFAEFERDVHAAVEAGDMPTCESLCQMYGDLNAKYYGPDVNYDEHIAIEWARIPHFYRAFYVYKYATGYSAATAISKKLIEEGQPARDNYLAFLKSGGCDYPVELLKLAGVDMSTPEPIEAAMQTFESLLDELESLIG
ncbi:MAG: oligoendopeptidase F [Clostridia bacterium]|nr:oligoendopeptidase F [Clostridia bacterium]